MFFKILVGCLRNPHQLLTSSMQCVTRSYPSFPNHHYCHATVLVCTISLWGLYTRFLALVHSLSSFPLVREQSSSFLSPFLLFSQQVREFTTRSPRSSTCFQTGLRLGLQRMISHFSTPIFGLLSSVLASFSVRLSL